MIQLKGTLLFKTRIDRENRPLYFWRVSGRCSYQIKHILFWTAASHSDCTFVNKASCNTFEKLMLFSSQRVFSHMGMFKVFFTALSLCCLAYSVISTSTMLTKALSAADSISNSFRMAAGLISPNELGAGRGSPSRRAVNRCRPQASWAMCIASATLSPNVARFPKSGKIQNTIDAGLTYSNS